MCRYIGHTYRPVMICLDCRIGMKGPRPDVDSYGGPIRCGRCGGDLLNMGHDFHVPRRRDRNQWRKLDRMVTAGVSWSSCGCKGPGPRPKTLADTKRWLR